MSERDWFSEIKLAESPKKLHDIAMELYRENLKLTVQLSASRGIVQAQQTFTEGLKAVFRDGACRGVEEADLDE